MLGHLLFNCAEAKLRLAPLYDLLSCFYCIHLGAIRRPTLFLLISAGVGAIEEHIYLLFQGFLVEQAIFRHVDKHLVPSLLVTQPQMFVNALERSVAASF